MKEMISILLRLDISNEKRINSCAGFYSKIPYYISKQKLIKIYDLLHLAIIIDAVCG